MNLLEYEAKRLLKTSMIPTPEGVTTKIASDIEFRYPCVVKSQVPVGGRGKAGGIRIVENENDLHDAVEALLSLDIKGYTPTTLLVEEKLVIEKELYLSALVSREKKSIELMANTNGGMEVEENEETSFLRLDTADFMTKTGINFDAIGDALADYFDLADKTFLLQDLNKKLLVCMKENDAMMIEINPLVLTTDGKLVAGDCKMTLDDAAAFRHSDWHFETPTHDANFVTLDENGQVATIANGAGLAMATVDAVTQIGLVPANFLDIGGGANEASVTKAFEKILEYKNVDAILINIFAGITRCDEVARAIIAARTSFPTLPQLFIRLEGTNSQQARELLAAHEISTFSSLPEALTGLKEASS